MRKFLAVFLLTLLLPLGASARPGGPVEIVDANISLESGVSTADVAKAVKKSMRARRWIVKNERAGYLEGTYTQRAGRRGPGYTVTIAVSYTAKKVNIRYKSSEGLDYRQEGGKRYIHGNYDRWIGNLERDIPVHLDRLTD